MSKKRWFKEDKRCRWVFVMTFPQHLLRFDGSTLHHPSGAADLGARHSSPRGADHHFGPLPDAAGARLLAPVLPEGRFQLHPLTPTRSSLMFTLVTRLLKDRCASWCDGCCPDISPASEQCCRLVEMCDCKVPSINSLWPRGCPGNPVSRLQRTLGLLLIKPSLFLCHLTADPFKVDPSDPDVNREQTHVLCLFSTVRELGLRVHVSPSRVWLLQLFLLWDQGPIGEGGGSWQTLASEQLCAN